MIRDKVVCFPIFLCLGANPTTNGTDRFVFFPFVLEWSSPLCCIVWFRFVFPYFSAPDVLVAGPGILASDHYLFRERRQ